MHVCVPQLGRDVRFHCHNYVPGEYEHYSSKNGGSASRAQK
jgi:hypothetical protein